MLEKRLFFSSLSVRVSQHAIDSVTDWNMSNRILIPLNIIIGRFHCFAFENNTQIIWLLISLFYAVTKFHVVESTATVARFSIITCSIVLHRHHEISSLSLSNATQDILCARFHFACNFPCAFHVYKQFLRARRFRYLHITHNGTQTRRNRNTCITLIAFPEISQVLSITTYTCYRVLLVLLFPPNCDSNHFSISNFIMIYSYIDKCNSNKKLFTFECVCVL